MVEQTTFNRLAEGSIPSALTNIIAHKSICGPAARWHKKEARDTLALLAKGTALCTPFMHEPELCPARRVRSRQGLRPLYSLYGWISVLIRLTTTIGNAIIIHVQGRLAQLVRALR